MIDKDSIENRVDFFGWCFNCDKETWQRYQGIQTDALGNQEYLYMCMGCGSMRRYEIVEEPRRILTFDYGVMT